MLPGADYLGGLFGESGRFCCVQYRHKKKILWEGLPEGGLLGKDGEGSGVSFRERECL